MSLFSRMFGTTESGEPSGPGEPDPGSELSQWPYASVPLPQGGAASKVAAPAPARPRVPPPPREPIAAASTAVNAVRALPTIVVHTPAPVAPELEEIELTLDWFAADTPASGFAPARLDDALKSRLGALLERLTRAHVAYERADAAGECTRKRSARNQRRAAALELGVLLTQIGEAELVEGLARSATERKIELVRGYLGSRGGERT